MLKQYLFLLIFLVDALAARAQPGPLWAGAPQNSDLDAASTQASQAPRPLGSALSPVGAWTGSLVIPGRILAVDLTIAEAGGHLTAILDIPLANLNHHAVTVTQGHDTLRFYDPAAEIHYECTQAPDGLLVPGHWVQPGFVAVLALTRPALARLASVRMREATKWHSGELENNLPVGSWDYYEYAADGQRQLVRTYDHSTGRVLFARPEENIYQVELSPGNWGFAALTQSPWFIGGTEDLAPYLAALRYPAAAQREKVAGKVTVSFVVDTLGHVSGHRVVRSLGSGCDEEALRVARTIPSTWAPGRVGSRAVPVVKQMAFTFRLL